MAEVILSWLGVEVVVVGVAVEFDVIGVVVEFDVAGVLLVQPATTMVLDKTSSMKARNLILEQLSILIYALILAFAQLIYYSRIRLSAGTEMPPLCRQYSWAF
jgi:Zn-dependent membrane protease YugP